MHRSAIRIDELVRHHGATDRQNGNSQRPGSVAEGYAEMRGAAENACGLPIVEARCLSQLLHANE
jgi:hypothetical protein